MPFNAEGMGSYEPGERIEVLWPREDTWRAGTITARRAYMLSARFDGEEEDRIWDVCAHPIRYPASAA